MKRKLIKSILLTVFLSLFITIPAMAVPFVNLISLNEPVQVGDMFQMQIWADSDGMDMDLLSFGFDVSISTGDVFNYSGYTLGAGFDDDSFGVGNVAGSAFPSIAGNDVLLATLSFTTVGLGTDSINITGSYDGTFSGLYYETETWEVIGYDISASMTTTTGTAPVPEPATILLFGAGLVSISIEGMRKKVIKM